MNRWAAACAVVALSAISSRALAAGPSADACVAASEDAQLSKVKGRLRAAHEKFLFCGNPACPKVVRNDCNARLEEVDRALPTVVLGAHDPAGKDLTSVRVSLDDQPLTDQLDGKAIAVDPGRHTFRFETANAPALERVVLVREGEKDRAITVTLGKPPPAHAAASSKKTPAEPESHGPSTATWVVGGIGAATLVGAGVIGLVALGKRSSLYDRCGKTGSCQQSEVDSVYRLYDIAYVGAGVGGALLITGAVLYFTTSSSPERHEVSVAPTLGGVSVSGSF